MARKRRPDPAPRPRRVNPLSDVEEAEGLLADLAAGPGRRRRKTGSLRQSVHQWNTDQALLALRGAADSITSNLDLRSLVKQILNAAIQMLGADRGILFLGRGADDGLVPVEALNIAGEELAEIEKVSTTILNRGQGGEVLLSNDAASDPRFADAPSIQVHKIRSVLCAPLVARGRRLGVLYLDAPTIEGAFAANAEQFLEAFAVLAAAALENARVHGDILRENMRLRRRLSSQESFARVLTLSPRMSVLLQRAALAAQVDAPILVLGEGGTGKELLGRSIHQAGPRALNPFVAYNCAVVPRELLESVFFGHARGAFPGAQREMPGLLREADRGVLFLNEIADLDLDLQAKLLRTLNEGVVRPVGGRRGYRVDVQLISASSRDIRADVRAGRFLEDLYYRINVFEMTVPPLRERQEDIPLLVNHFVEKHAPNGHQAVAGGMFTRGAMEFLQSLPWRGNVSELESLVRRVLVLADRPKVDVAQLRAMVPEPAQGGADAPGTWPASATHGGQIRPFVEQEREALREALVRAGGNKSKAARLLGLHRNTLLRRIKKLKVTTDV